MLIFTKGDKIIVGMVVVAVILAYLTFAVGISDEKAEGVEIFVAGKLYASYDLNRLETEQLVEIKSQYGKNILKLTPDGVVMTDASCPDKKDVKDGMITRPGQMLICVPNRVSVRLVGNNLQVDKVTY